MRPVSLHLHDALRWIVLLQELLLGYLKVLLQEGQFPQIGSQNGLEPPELVEKVRILAKVVDSVGIDDHNAVAGQCLDYFGEEVVHIEISAQSGANHPGMDGFLPVSQLGGPPIQHDLLLLLGQFEFLLGDEQRVGDYFRGVGLDGWGTEPGAEDMAEVPADLESRDGGVVGCPCELEGSSDDGETSVLPLGVVLVERREDCC